MDSNQQHNFEFKEAVSHIIHRVIHRDNEDEVDYYSDNLSEGGELQEK